MNGTMLLLLLLLLLVVRRSYSCNSTVSVFSPTHLLLCLLVDTLLLGLLLLPLLCLLDGLLSLRWWSFEWSLECSPSSPGAAVVRACVNGAWCVRVSSCA